MELVSIFVLSTGVYAWIKCPKACKNMYTKQSLEELYYQATVIESYGIEHKVQRPCNKNDNYEHFYINKVKCEYLNCENVKMTEIIHIPTTYAGTEKNIGDVIYLVYDKKDDVIRYLEDTFVSKDKLIEARTKGLVFLCRFFLSFWILTGIMFIFS